MSQEKFLVRGFAYDEKPEPSRAGLRLNLMDLFRDVSNHYS